MRIKKRRIIAVLLILMALFALIRIGTSTYENAVRKTAITEPIP